MTLGVIIDTGGTVIDTGKFVKVPESDYILDDSDLEFYSGNYY